MYEIGYLTICDTAFWSLLPTAALNCVQNAAKPSSLPAASADPAEISKPATSIPLPITDPIEFMFAPPCNNRASFNRPHVSRAYMDTLKAFDETLHAWLWFNTVE